MRAVLLDTGADAAAATGVVVTGGIILAAGSTGSTDRRPDRLAASATTAFSF